MTGPGTAPSGHEKTRLAVLAAYLTAQPFCRSRQQIVRVQGVVALRRRGECARKSLLWVYLEFGERFPLTWKTNEAPPCTALWAALECEGFCWPSQHVSGGPGAMAAGRSSSRVCAWSGARRERTTAPPTLQKDAFATSLLSVWVLRTEPSLERQRGPPNMRRPRPRPYGADGLMWFTNPYNKIM